MRIIHKNISLNEYNQFKERYNVEWRQQMSWKQINKRVFTQRVADVTAQATPLRHHARGGDVENMEERDM